MRCRGGRKYLSGVQPSDRPGEAGFLLAGRLLTLAPGIEGDAIYWRDGRIVAAGRAADVARQVPRGTPEITARRGLVTPGMVDAHTHFGQWALGRLRVNLTGCDGAESLRRVASANAEDGWILGQGWDANDWDAPPERGMLDRVQTGPVWLDSLDVHAAWLNSAALEALGVNRGTPDPPGGRIVRDAAGEPTGILLERAAELAAERLPPPDPERLTDALRDATAQLHRLGVTGIHDMSDRYTLAALEALDEAGTLGVRVVTYPPLAMLDELAGRGLHTGAGSDMLRFGGVKLFLDGSLGSRTAWMLEPYRGSRDRGMPVMTAKAAADGARRAVAAGFAMAAHAIGDAAVRRALDIMATLPMMSAPHRIEHLQCVDPADLDRAARSRIVASMQPAHLLVDIPLAERHWGARSAGAYAFRSLMRRGTVVAFGSDTPVATPDPRAGIFASLARTDLGGKPAGGWYVGETIGFRDAVAAYTIAPAVAGGVSARRGRLAPGWDADFVVWDADPDLEQNRGETIFAARPTMTVVAGRIVWSEATDGS